MISLLIINIGDHVFTSFQWESIDTIVDIAMKTQMISIDPMGYDAGASIWVHLFPFGKSFVLGRLGLFCVNKVNLDHLRPFGVILD